jgi:hypothetical protein
MFFYSLNKLIQDLLNKNNLEFYLSEVTDYQIFINPNIESRTFVFETYTLGDNKEIKIEENDNELFEIILGVISESKDLGCTFLDEDFTIIISSFESIQVKIRRDNDSFINNLSEKDRELLFSPDPLRFDFEPYEFLLEEIEK